MRTLLILLLLLPTICGFTQNGYRITYKTDHRYYPNKIKGEEPVLFERVDKLVFNDTLSFWYITGKRNDPYEKKNDYGDMIIHHCLFYNANTYNYYHGVVQVKKARKSKNYLIVEILKEGSYILIGDSKTILNYQCKSALYVDEKKDSTLVWYTDEISRPFGPGTYFGLPGVVLEVYEKRNDWHMVASLVEEGPFRVFMPKDAIIVSREKFVKIKR